MVYCLFSDITVITTFYMNLFVSKGNEYSDFDNIIYVVVKFT